MSKLLFGNLVFSQLPTIKLILVLSSFALSLALLIDTSEISIPTIFFGSNSVTFSTNEPTPHP